MERSGSFRGFYDCLGGKLSPLDHVSPDDLRIAPLLQRVHAGVEVILALGSDVEGKRRRIISLRNFADEVAGSLASRKGCLPVGD